MVSAQSREAPALRKVWKSLLGQRAATVSDDLLRRALQLIPNGVQTFSKSRAVWPDNAPSHIKSGMGSHVWGSDGREFIDMTMALGPIVLGYGDPDVDAAVREAIISGPIFTFPSSLEVALADKITRIVPCAETVKFELSGSDAASAAIRCARAFTGKWYVVSQGYHGWHDWCCPNRTGLPHTTEDYADCEDPSVFREDDWRDAFGSGSVEDDTAAIIVEPEYTQDLPGLRRFCSDNGIVLIFDEVLTGFRVALGGFQEYSGVIPDLATFSKAMGNGYPISCVTGKREVMKAFERIGVSSTFFGSTPGLAASLAVIDKMQTEPVIDHLWSVGKRLRVVFEAEAKAAGISVELRGLAPRMTYHFKGDGATVPWRTLFAQSMIAAGVLSNFGLTACWAHDAVDIEKVSVAIRSAFRVLASVDDPRERLHGEARLAGVRPG